MPFSTSGVWRAGVAVLLLSFVAACSTPPDTVARSEPWDPYEKANRGVHAFNKGVDIVAVRPVSVVYSSVTPDLLEDSISRAADNLSIPSIMINQIFQGDFVGSFRNGVRFGINSTLGFAGLLDPAAEFGLEEVETDFGETLAVWGIPQGAYVELPLLGPSTERAAFGFLVDLAINPLSGALYPNPALNPPYDNWATFSRGASIASNRGQFVNTIDGVLYESADSYVASRDLYLQRRAFELEQVGVAPETDDDPYADIFGE